MKTATKPPQNTLYETDFYAWTQEQARVLRERRWDDLDLENLVDEVASVGGSEKREIRNRLTILLAHLLKWKHQPGLRGASWRSTIFEQRDQLADIVRDSPSLREFLLQQVNDRYLGGRLLAAKETGIAFGLFPEECPFTPEQVLDPEFFPEDRSIE
jgi:hypothetical protein